MMPDFLGSGGLEGTDFTYLRAGIVLTKTDGQVFETALLDALVRNGFSRGEASVLNFTLVNAERDTDGTLQIYDRNNRIWDIAVKGIQPDGPIDRDSVKHVLLVLDEAVIDIRDWPNQEPSFKRLAERKVVEP